MLSSRCRGHHRRRLASSGLIVMLAVNDIGAALSLACRPRGRCVRGRTVCRAPYFIDRYHDPRSTSCFRRRRPHAAGGSSWLSWWCSSSASTVRLRLAHDARRSQGGRWNRVCRSAWRRAGPGGPGALDSAGAALFGQTGVLRRGVRPGADRVDDPEVRGPRRGARLRAGRDGLPRARATVVTPATTVPIMLRSELRHVEAVHVELAVRVHVEREGCAVAATPAGTAAVAAPLWCRLVGLLVVLVARVRRRQGAASVATVELGSDPRLIMSALSVSPPSSVPRSDGRSRLLGDGCGLFSSGAAARLMLNGPSSSPWSGCADCRAVGASAAP